MYHRGMKRDTSGCWFFVNGREAIAEVASYALQGERSVGGAPTWTIRVTGRVGADIEAVRGEVEESIRLYVMLPSLMLLDIEFPDESAEGIEHVHAAESWVGRVFEVHEDGSVLAVFDGPLPPVVTRETIVRPCRLPHPECAAA